MKTYSFLHKRIMNARPFRVKAIRFYEAVSQLESILGPEKHWMHDYLVLSDGKQVGYLVAS
jgi:hypothetical protein